MPKEITMTDFISFAANNNIKFEIPDANKRYPMQQCQDDAINEDFRSLHGDIVDLVIQFCIKHGITADEFHISADDLSESIEKGSWQPRTDSCFTLDKFTQEYKDVSTMKKLVSDEEWKRIESEQEPFLLSM